MNDKNFREELVKLVKASGQEVIDRAEDLVGGGDLISDFDIRLRFHISGGSMVVDEVPTIEVTRSHLSKNTIKVLTEH